MTDVRRWLVHISNVRKRMLCYCLCVCEMWVQFVRDTFGFLKSPVGFKQLKKKSQHKKINHRKIFSMFIFGDKVLKECNNILGGYLWVLTFKTSTSLSYIGIQSIFKLRGGERNSTSQGESYCSWSGLVSLHSPIPVVVLVFVKLCVCVRACPNMYTLIKKSMYFNRQTLCSQYKRRLIAMSGIH